MTERSEPYVVNLAVHPLRWTPNVWQLRPFLNPSWLNSLWLGTVWNAFLLPHRVCMEVVRPLLTGRPLDALVGVFAVPISVVLFLLWGVGSRLRAHSLPIDVSVNARFLDEHEAKAAMLAGRTQIVRQTRPL